MKRILGFAARTGNPNLIKHHCHDMFRSLIVREQFTGHINMTSKRWQKDLYSQLMQLLISLVSWFSILESLPLHGRFSMVFLFLEVYLMKLFTHTQYSLLLSWVNFRIILTCLIVIRKKRKKITLSSYEWPHFTQTSAEEFNLTKHTSGWHRVETICKDWWS